MIPSLLLPAGLAALAALLLPLLLHLARREDRRPVDFAALRWLSPRARPRRSLRFEEWLLLVLRLLLIALLALLLARPVLPVDGGGTPWIMAMPGVGAEALRGAAWPAAGDAGAAVAGGHTLDSESDAVERRWLSAGFPALDEAPPPAAPQSTISLLRELDMRLPAGTPLVVLVPPVLDGVDAERPRLSRPVEWRVLDASPASPAGNDGSDAAAAAGVTARDSGLPPPRLFIDDAGQEAGARYLRALSAAWRTAAADEDEDGSGDASSAAQASAAESPATGALEVRSWLTAGQLPPEALAWIEAGGTALLAHDTRLPALEAAPVLWSDDEGRALLRGSALGGGRVLQWTRPLDPEAMPVLLEADFPRRLLAVLQPPPPPARVQADAHVPQVGDVGPWPQSLRELSPWLALVIALLFLVERWLAAGPRGERAP